MVGAFTRGLNIKSVTITILAVFAYVFITDYIIHGVILMEAYQQSAPMWRSPEQMQSFFPWMLVGQFLIAKFFVLIFAKGYEGNGIGEGVRFGLLLGFFNAGAYFIQYAVSPLPLSILWGWIGLGLLQTIGGGVLAAGIYKKA